MSKILYRENHAEVDAIDTGLGNKWRWDWMEKVVSVDMNTFERITWKSDDPLNICLKDCINKVDEPGKAICLLCKKSDNVLKYGIRGVAALTKHVQRVTM